MNSREIVDLIGKYLQTKEKIRMRGGEYERRV
jgi:hypothetical protein